MGMTRSLSELKAECKKLGLTVIPAGKKEGKADFVNALANYFIQKDPRKGQYGFEFLMSIESPMLCQRIQYLKPAEQEEIMKDGNNWLFTEKLDGARIVVTYHPDQGFDFYSRNISVKDYLPVSYKDTVWLGDKDWSKVFKTAFVVDTEIISKDKNINTILGNRGVVTETQLQSTTALMSMDPSRSIPIQKETGGFGFHIFDVLKVGDRSVMDLELKDRLPILEKIISALQREGFPAFVVKSFLNNKKDGLDSIIANGGEGVVAKNLNSKYVATESRGRDRWVKIKRSIKNGLGDNIDAFITGFEKGESGSGWETYVGSLELSLFVVKENGEEYQHMIARVTNIPMELRKVMTEIKDGNPILKSEYYGKVVEITGQDVSSRARRLSHASIVRWRPDRDYLSCKLEEKVLNENIL